ncbi:MAG: methyltransferase domain-containing protein [Methyloligellaceae bacterium]
MNSDRKKQIASSFGKNASQYDDYAGLQARVAAELASHMPRRESIRVLEIGCGTGLFTEHLLGLYNRSEIYITDLSEGMLETCQSRIGPHPDITYLQCDGERVLEHEVLAKKSFDIIATSMTIQWFQNPVQSLALLTEMLNPEGQLFYATIGPDCFPEWQAVLKELDAPAGTIAMPTLPGQFSEQNIEVQHDDARDFFQSLKAIGAATPGGDYTPLSAGTMRRALRLLDEKSSGKINWQIVYGSIGSIAHF